MVTAFADPRCHPASLGVGFAQGSSRRLTQTGGEEGYGVTDWDTEDWSTSTSQSSSSAAHDWGSEADVSDPNAVPTASAPTVMWLWIGLGSAVVGLALGALVMVLANFKLETLGTLAVALTVLGWLLSGTLAVVALAGYQRLDLRAATSAYYTAEPTAIALRTTVLVVGAIGVILNAYVFATWLAGR